MAAVDRPGYAALVRRRRQAVLLSVCLVVLVGLPLWWNTTRVYRAQLPLAPIRRWTEQATPTAVRWPIQVHLQLPEPSAWPAAPLNATRLGLAVADTAQASLVARRQPGPAANATQSPLAIQLDVQVSASTGSRSVAPTGASAQSEKQPPAIAIRLHALDNEPQLPSAPPQPKVRIDSTTTVDLWVPLPATTTHETLVRWIDRLITALLAGHERTLNALAAKHTDHQPPHLRQELQRTVHHATHYQLTFSLLHADSTAVALDWAIAEGLAHTIRPFLAQLNGVLEFTVDSQVQHYAPLAITPALVASSASDTDAGSNLRSAPHQPYYALTPAMLPHFVNAQDWNLASTETTYPLLNFLTYVPSEPIAPLQLLAASGDPAPLSAFVIPRWGGVVVHNLPSSRTAATAAPPKYTLTADELAPVLRVFLSQLRQLLGITDPIDAAQRELATHFAVAYDPRTTTGLTEWELVALLSKRSVRQVAEAVSTLHSFQQVITSMPNMVVLDTIRDKAVQSLHHLDAFTTHMAQGQLWAAYTDATQALSLAESAFFDPTILALLYFPDEHKYGVYMPLFVPALVPIVVLLLKELKEWRARRVQAKTKTE
ncbi:GPI transamidase component [Dimargaris xerosporica]|nr:GPI transamidase component [Dimargaris xerosporica]